MGTFIVRNNINETMQSDEAKDTFSCVVGFGKGETISS